MSVSWNDPIGAILYSSLTMYSATSKQPFSYLCQEREHHLHLQANGCVSLVNVCDNVLSMQATLCPNLKPHEPSQSLWFCKFLIN